MLVLPWYIRLTIDCVIISTPFLYLNSHPTTHLFEYFQNKRRIGRRLTPEELGDNMSENGTQNLAQSKQLYKKLGMEY